MPRQEEIRHRARRAGTWQLLWDAARSICRMPLEAPSARSAAARRVRVVGPVKAPPHTAGRFAPGDRQWPRSLPRHLTPPSPTSPCPVRHQICTSRPQNGAEVNMSTRSRWSRHSATRRRLLSAGCSCSRWHLQFGCALGVVAALCWWRGDIGTSGLMSMNTGPGRRSKTGCLGPELIMRWWDPLSRSDQPHRASLHSAPGRAHFCARFPVRGLRCGSGFAARCTPRATHAFDSQGASAAAGSLAAYQAAQHKASRWRPSSSARCCSAGSGPSITDDPGTDPDDDFPAADLLPAATAVCSFAVRRPTLSLPVLFGEKRPQVRDAMAGLVGT